MIELKTQKDFRLARDGIDFCYLCGKPLQLAGTELSYDHVVHRKIFHKDAREPSLKLPAHKQCNNNWSDPEHAIEYFIGNKVFEPPKARSKIPPVHDFGIGSGGVPVVGFGEIPLTPVVWKWIRGFHTALYKHRPDIDPKKTSLHLPFPHAYGEPDQADLDPHSGIFPQHVPFVEAIKKNRIANRLDRIVAYGEQLLYECTWEQLDNGDDFCLFALRVNEWERFADRRNFIPRGCIGMYCVKGSVPLTASRGMTRLLEFPFENNNPLDPFAD